MTNQNKAVCPVCRRLIARYENGAFVKHGHRGPFQSGSCVTSNVNTEAGIMLALERAEEHLEAMESALTDKDHLSANSPIHRPTKAIRETNKLSAWVETLRQALAFCQEAR